MKKSVLVGVIVVVIVITSYSIWTYVNNLDYLRKTVHETDRWAVITDSYGDIIAVETTNDEIWDTLNDLHQNQTEMWIGGIVEEYTNTWGFRFQPDTIIIAKFTVEGGQTTIEGISDDLDYWMDTWGTWTYVLARTTEIHEST